MTTLPANGDWKKLAIRWGTGGTICAIVLKLLELAQQPQMLSAIVSWGPLFVLAILGLVGADRRMGQFITVLERNGLAIETFVGEQKRLVDSTRDIAETVHYVSQKDDNRAAATEAAIGFVAQQNEKISGDLKGIAVGLQGFAGELAEIKSRLPK